MKITKQQLTKMIKEELFKENDYEVENTELSVGNWSVQLHQDEDGHLSVWVKHRDGTTIYDIEGAEYEEEAEFEFTTQGIEDAYRKTMGE